MIYIFNACGNIMYKVMKQTFDLSEENIFDIINTEFAQLQDRLALKRIKYNDLKGALVPNQDADKYETCLVFDSSQIKDSFYGNIIWNILLPLMDKDSTYSVLCGDYIDVSQDVEGSQKILRDFLNRVICRCNQSKFQHSSQYYLIYINRLSPNQRWTIVEGLLKYPWFTGFADLSAPSDFKAYISAILVPSFIKYKNKIIGSHPSDYQDEENVNMSNYSFDNHGFSFVSINEESFGPFLSYKIESEFADPYEFP